MSYKSEDFCLCQKNIVTWLLVVVKEKGSSEERYCHY